ncbi:hypothetical protein AUK22_09845 [bacterium CG2_30_54_10]|nr:MAG: hypothetical protein AUK22_09845 [bacterium CG2_30_54_10]
MILLIAFRLGEEGASWSRSASDASVQACPLKSSPAIAFRKVAKTVRISSGSLASRAKTSWKLLAMMSSFSGVAGKPCARLRRAFQT